LTLKKKKKKKMQAQTNHQEPEILTRMYAKVQKLGEGTYGKEMKDSISFFFFVQNYFCLQIYNAFFNHNLKILGYHLNLKVGLFLIFIS